MASLPPCLCVSIVVVCQRPHFYHFNLGCFEQDEIIIETCQTNLVAALLKVILRDLVTGSVCFGDEEIEEFIPS